MNRILMVTGLSIWSLGSKSGAASFFQTIKGYLDHGYRIDLISGSPDENTELLGLTIFHHRPTIFNQWAKIRKIGFFFRAIEWIRFQICVIFRGAKLIKRNRPNLIYAYEIAGVPAAVFLGRVFCLPVISRFQGTIIKPRMNSFGWRLRYWEHWLALRAKSDLAIMADDGTQGDYVLKYLDIPMEKIRFWMNGVDVDPSKADPLDKERIKKQLGIDAKDTILLAASRLVKWKRVDRIIRAMPEIIRSIPQAILLILGDGEERIEYEDLVRSLDLEGHVSFKGPLPRSQVRAYMEIADLFVSLYDLSNVGNPLLEAMSLGKCAFVLNNGGTGSIIKNDINGVLIDEDMMGRVSSKIIELLLDKDRLNRLGSAAREYAKTHFVSWERRMDKEVREIESMFKSSFL